MTSLNNKTSPWLLRFLLQSQRSSGAVTKAPLYCLSTTSALFGCRHSVLPGPLPSCWLPPACSRRELLQIRATNSLFILMLSCLEQLYNSPPILVQRCLQEQDGAAGTAGEKCGLELGGEKFALFKGNWSLSYACPNHQMRSMDSSLIFVNSKTGGFSGCLSQ